MRVYRFKTFLYSNISIPKRRIGSSITHKRNYLRQRFSSNTQNQKGKHETIHNQPSFSKSKLQLPNTKNCYFTSTNNIYLTKSSYHTNNHKHNSYSHFKSKFLPKYHVTNAISKNYYHKQKRYFTGINPHPNNTSLNTKLEIIKNGPSLQDFLLSPSDPNDNTIFGNDINIDNISYNPNKAGRTLNSRTNEINNINGHNLGKKFSRNPKSKNRKPEWLKIPKIPKGPKHEELKNTVNKLGLATVCEEARCPNIGVCWGGSGSDSNNDDETIATATIMLMGDTCTRACRFCSVKTSKSPLILDENEPYRVGKAILQWGLHYVVLTSVDRDDYYDGGANHIANTVKIIKSGKMDDSENNVKNIPFVEVLTPDFQGNEESIEKVALSGLDVFAHNIETTRNLTPYVRDRRANYIQSLNVLNYAKKICKLKTSNEKNLLTKSSIMLGFGETKNDILQSLNDLREIGNCDIVTLGQYLQPTKGHLKVTEYVHPDIFEFYKQEAEKMGFLYVASGPLVRSSYKAGEYFIANYLSKQDNINENKEQSTSISI